MRLIDAERASATLREEAAFLLKNGPDTYGTGRARGLIDAAEVIACAPTVDAVEVVRCGDCKYGVQLADDRFFCKRWSSFSVEAEEGFCVYGERWADNG